MIQSNPINGVGGALVLPMIIGAVVPMISQSKSAIFIWEERYVVSKQIQPEFTLCFLKFATFNSLH